MVVSWLGKLFYVNAGSALNLVLAFSLLFLCCFSGVLLVVSSLLVGGFVWLWSAYRRLPSGPDSPAW
jgi:hypothetical protein